jgi:hypothetical protein
MRFLSATLMILGLLTGYGAFVMVTSVDLVPLASEARTAAHMLFNALALCGLALPALSLLALIDDADLRRKYPHRYRKARR